MEEKARIGKEPWIKWPQTQAVMHALGGDCVEGHESLFVGGCVRNAILGLNVTDIDIATVHKPEIVKIKLQDAGIKTVDTGIDHGTVTAIKDDKKFEITTLRKDVKTDGRHANVVFTHSWEEDAARRDFTMNTLLSDAHGAVFDPTGQGLEDIKKKRVVFVGDPARRIQEDYLRILRFFRFFGLYGDGLPDSHALAACKRYAHGLQNLSKERIGQEFFKILALNRAADILSLMSANNILSSLLQGDLKLGLPQLIDRQRGFDCVDVYSRFLVVAAFDVSVGDSFLVFSNKEKALLEKAVKAYDFLKMLNEKELRACVYWYGNDATLRAYFLKTLLPQTTFNPAMVDMARYWQAPEFPVTGAALMAQGYAQGPELGNRLRAMERAWVENGFML